MQTRKIKNGVSSFGSANITAPADTAIVNIAVESVGSTAKKAFTRNKDTSQKVKKYLNKVHSIDVSTSRINLSQNIDWKTKQLIHYSANISYRIKLSDLDIVEDILTNVTELGANRIQSVIFQSSKLKEYRRKARRLAVDAAREKAENYCDAAGVELGGVLAIEDINPDGMENRIYRGEALGNTGGVQNNAIAAGDINIAGAVNILFSIKS